MEKVTNEDVLRKVNEDKQTMTVIEQWKHRWMGHVWRQHGLLGEITEGRRNGKRTGRRRLQMLHDLTKG